MGCFSATCGISHLGIGPGDRVKFLLLQSVGDADNLQCYPDSLWAIFAPPFDAHYNDYGSVENWDPNDPNFKFAMKLLRAQLVERPVGENEYHDVSVSKTGTDEALFTALWENRVLVQGPFDRVQVRPCIIRADVWDLLMKQSVKHGWRDEILSLENSVKKTKQASNAMHKSLSSDDFVTRTDFLMSEPNLFSSSQRWPLASSINIAVSKGALPKSELDELVPVLGECDHFMDMLDKLRIALYPSNTIGEQRATYDAHAKWFDGLAKLAKKLDKLNR